ncbi:uncharacterized protein LOC112197765 isoform X2 [Rosa chinensis]|uniref:uncharacterized protein LOC112197765 isoform X2 n=1 Tax=Rosa chinensis TaxID=74649 RepID=UPI001AD91DDF|nr:uncharacterized protein LOC112197765 isoform X2 [Rosa chinensis]
MELFLFLIMVERISRRKSFCPLIGLGLIQRGSMVGFAYPLGFMSTSGYVIPNKEFHWLAYALFGMLLCKIVYKLTGLISLQSFKEYQKLS